MSNDHLKSQAIWAARDNGHEASRDDLLTAAATATDHPDPMARSILSNSLDERGGSGEEAAATPRW